LFAIKIGHLQELNNLLNFSHMASVSLAISLVFYRIVDTDGFACTSLTNNAPVMAATQKGLSLDDTTYQWCSDKMLTRWPNTQVPVGTLRTFMSWRDDLAQFMKKSAQSNLLSFANVKIFVGTMVSCSEAADAAEWKDTVEIIKLLGPDRIMAVSVGNEIDGLYGKPYSTPECIRNMWSGGYLWRETVRRIAELDALGSEFAKLPVTSTISGEALKTQTEAPFIDDPSKMMVESYLRNASQAYNDRWVWTFNFYSYWSIAHTPLDELPQKRGKPDCTKIIERATCFDKSECETIKEFESCRCKISQITGKTNDTIWIGELGWSSPQVGVNNSVFEACPIYHEMSTFKSFYRNFLSYEMGALPNGQKGPAHIFFFAQRDSSQFGVGEHFGLIGPFPDPGKICEWDKCKIQVMNVTGMSTPSQTTPAITSIATMETTSSASTNIASTPVASSSSMEQSTTTSIAITTGETASGAATTPSGTTSIGTTSSSPTVVTDNASMVGVLSGANSRAQRSILMLSFALGVHCRIILHATDSRW
jgi:hypothetical protein